MFRFFTVYGPWGRPDMALFKFTKAILTDQAIDVYNHGNMIRDFTYVEDLAESIIKYLTCTDPTGSVAKNVSCDSIYLLRHTALLILVTQNLYNLLSLFLT